MPGSVGPWSTSTSPTAMSSWRPRIGEKRRRCTRIWHWRWPRLAVSRRCTGPSWRARCGRPWREARSSPLLRAAGGWNRDIRREQRSRDRETVRAFAAVAARQYGLERRRSTSVTAVLLGALDAVLAQWRVDPTEENRRILVETYLAMVVGAYAEASTDLSASAAT